MFASNTSETAAVAIAAAALTVSAPAPAAPAISAVERLAKQSDEGTSHFVVRGEDFGSKDQGPAVLYDYVTHAYENGQQNSFHRDAMSNGQDMHTVHDRTRRVYDTASGPLDQGGSQGFNPAQYITDDPGRAERMHRHPLVDAHYRMRNKAYIGLPMAYGGDHEDEPEKERFQRPDDKRQLYIAWWMRPTLSPREQHIFDFKSVSGDPDFGGSKWRRGERFVVPGGGPGDSDAKGWLIGKRDGTADVRNPDDDGWIEIEFDSPQNFRLMDGKTLQAQESGATLEFPDDLDDRVINFHGSAKLMRAWSKGGEPFGFAWQPNGLNLGAVPRQTWGRDVPGDPKAKQWNLLEFVADLEEGWIEGRVNFKTRDRVEWDPDILDPLETSPTLQLVGMHTQNFGFNTFRLSEVYQDSTIQRVVIADARRLEDATHYELQRPIEWSADAIEFAANPGQIRDKTDDDENLYVFVFNEDDQVNEEGFPISLDGMVQPPKAPQIEGVEVTGSA